MAKPLFPIGMNANYVSIDGFVLEVLSDDPASKPDGHTYYKAGVGPRTKVEGAYQDVVGGASVGDGTITLAKLADLATNKIIGRATTGTGVPEAIDCTAAGRALIDDADATAQRATLGLGDSATKSVGTGAGTVAAGDDSRLHTQGTDTGTTSATYTVGSGGVKIKNVAGVLAIRSNADDADADLTAKDGTFSGNLIITGNVTVIGNNQLLKGNTVAIGDNEIELNSEIALASSNASGGIAIKRFAADDSTRRDAKFGFNETTDRWDATYGPHTAAQITRVAALKYTALFGDAVETTFTIAQSTHGLAADGSLLVQVTDVSTGAVEYPATTINDSTGSIGIDYGATVPGTNSKRITVIG